MRQNGSCEGAVLYCNVSLGCAGQVCPLWSWGLSPLLFPLVVGEEVCFFGKELIDFDKHSYVEGDIGVGVETIFNEVVFGLVADCFEGLGWHGGFEALKLFAFIECVMLFASFFVFSLTLVVVVVFAALVALVIGKGTVGVLEDALKGLGLVVGFGGGFVGKLDDVADAVCAVFGNEVGCVEEGSRGKVYGICVVEEFEEEADKFTSLGGGWIVCGSFARCGGYVLFFTW